MSRRRMKNFQFNELTARYRLWRQMQLFMIIYSIANGRIHGVTFNQKNRQRVRERVSDKISKRNETPPSLTSLVARVISLANWK